MKKIIIIIIFPLLILLISCEQEISKDIKAETPKSYEAITSPDFKQLTSAPNADDTCEMSVMSEKYWLGKKWYNAPKKNKGGSKWY